MKIKSRVTKTQIADSDLEAFTLEDAEQCTFKVEGGEDKRYGLRERPLLVA